VSRAVAALGFELAACGAACLPVRQAAAGASQPACWAAAAAPAAHDQPRQRRTLMYFFSTLVAVDTSVDSVFCWLGVSESTRWYSMLNLMGMGL
jgi:hypothetical protein